MTVDATVPTPPRRRILLVEDNEAACRSLARLLEAKGFVVTTVQDGASALRALKDGRPPDFLLTDLQLPDIDGREVARHARGLNPAPRIIAITGWDLGSEPEEPSVSGFDWVLTKPIDLSTLLEILNC
jgi:CheY-like chemotaxis protein